MVVTEPLNADQVNELLSSLTQASALTELAVLVGCLFVAWGLVRLLRGKEQPEGSIWFGKRIVDGVFFPVLALTLAFGAKLALAGAIKPAVFKVAIPILISLVVIRISVRVLAGI